MEGAVDSEAGEGPPLSPSQAAALAAVEAGQSVWISGGAGVGKSHLLRLIVARLRQRDAPFLLTATTGVAAVQVGAATLHSAFRLNPARLESLPTAEVVRPLVADPHLMKRLAEARLLLVDEVSMATRDVLDAVDVLLRHAHRSSRPFGGVQLVLVGDAYQLPPVVKRPSKGGGDSGDDAATADEDLPAEALEALWPAPGRRPPRSARPFFACPAVWRALDAVVQLTECFRQEGDGGFADLLNRLRVGAAAAEDLAAINARVGASLDHGDGVQPTVLYALNAGVDAHNARELAALPGEARTFRGRTGVRVQPSKARYLPPDAVAKMETPLWVKADQMVRDLNLGAVVLGDGGKASAVGGSAGGSAAGPSVPTCSLKVGAQVQLTKNVNVALGLVNGSRGVVVGFARSPTAYGQAGEEAKTACAEGLKAAAELNARELPVVRFVDLRPRPPAAKTSERAPKRRRLAPTDAGGEARDSHGSSSDGGGSDERASEGGGAGGCGTVTITHTVAHELWLREEKGLGKVWAVALPLRCAWATSIHRAQGLTIPRLQVCLRGVFEWGHAYVALSRAPSLASLTLTDPLRPEHVSADPSVHRWLARPLGEWRAMLPADDSDEGGGAAAAPPPPRPAAPPSRRKAAPKRPPPPPSALTMTAEELMAMLGATTASGK